MSATNEEMITTAPAPESRRLPAEDLTIAKGNRKSARAGSADASSRGNPSSSRARRGQKSDGRTAPGTVPVAGENARTGDNDLPRRLREFASVHSAGWNHNQWLSLLEKLEQEGFDVTSPDAIGAELERARLDVVLTRAGGPGRTGRKNLVERYQTLWAFQEADSEELAITAEVSRRVIDRIKAEAAGQPV